MTEPLNLKQLGDMSKSALQQRIVALGMDYHPAESKPNLVARILQLQGTAQPTDKLLKDIAAAGIADEGLSAKPPIPDVKKKLSVADVKKALTKYVDRGLKWRFTDEHGATDEHGDYWEMVFRCPQVVTGGKVITARRSDSGNRQIPVSVLTRCAEVLVTFNAPAAKRDEVDEHEYMGEDA